MFKRIALVLSAIAVGLTMGLVGLNPVGASGHSAERSFPATSIGPDEQLVVTIAVANYGGIGQLVETLPSGFTYVSSDPSAAHDAANRTLTFNLLGDASVTYTVTTPPGAGTHTFSGILRDSARLSEDVDGQETITVVVVPTVEPGQDGATALRSFLPESVQGGEQVVVTIAVADYGGIGQLVETLPSDFTHVSSDPSAEHDAVSRTLTFNLVSDTSVTYTVTALAGAGAHNFAGILRDSGRASHTVGGSTAVTVEEPTVQGPTARRSFLPASVQGGGQVVVTIAVADYGGIGHLVETLPSGFTYMSSDPSAEHDVVNRSLTFNLVNDASVAYTVTAPAGGGTHTFTGILKDSGRASHSVGGSTMVTVQGPTARRSFLPASVQGGGQVVVSIAVANYGGIGQLVETLPSGFTYVSSDPSAEHDAANRTLTFNLVNDTSVTYTVTAPAGAGTHTFSGTLEDSSRASHTISGSTAVSFAKPSTATPEPTATPAVSPWKEPQTLSLNVMIRPIIPMIDKDIDSYTIEKGRLPRNLRLHETTGYITGRPVRETALSTTVTIKVCDTSENCEFFELRFPPVRDRTVEEDAPTPTLPDVPPIDLSGVTVGDAAPSSGLQFALAATGGALLLGGIGVMTARRRVRARVRR